MKRKPPHHSTAEMDAIRRAIRVVGSVPALVEKSGIAEPTIYAWLAGTRRMSAAMAIRMDRATGGQVERRELRPDIFGVP